MHLPPSEDAAEFDEAESVGLEALGKPGEEREASAAEAEEEGRFARSVSIFFAGDWRPASAVGDCTHMAPSDRERSDAEPPNFFFSSRAFFFALFAWFFFRFLSAFSGSAPSMTASSESSELSLVTVGLEVVPDAASQACPDFLRHWELRPPRAWSLAYFHLAP